MLLARTVCHASTVGTSATNRVGTGTTKRTETQNKEVPFQNKSISNVYKVFQVGTRDVKNMHNKSDQFMLFYLLVTASSVDSFMAVISFLFSLHLFDRFVQFNHEGPCFVETDTRICDRYSVFQRSFQDRLRSISNKTFNHKSFDGRMSCFC